MIKVERARFVPPSVPVHIRSAADSTVVGVPIMLLAAGPEAVGLPAREGGGVPDDGVIEENRIEENRIVGASGLAIEVVGASRNRIANNTIRGVVPRQPFPGNTLFAEAPRWRAANGSGIWISPESEANQILGNTFEDISSFVVFLQGDSNRVILQNASEAVRDLGNHNRIYHTLGIEPCCEE